jgi:hypothetical protein
MNQKTELALLRLRRVLQLEMKLERARKSLIKCVAQLNVQEEAEYAREGFKMQEEFNGR